jgi:hypothetical protein
MRFESMKQLFDNQLVPLTFKWGFLEAPFQKIIETNENWKQSIYSSVKVHAADLPLNEALLELQPLTIPKRHELFVITKSDWVAYFDNGIRGGDPVGTLVHLSETLKCRGLIVTNIPHTHTGDSKNAKGVYGAIQFELLASSPREFLNYERTISATNDGGKWVFHADGKVQSFEKIEQYNNKRVKDKFTSEMLDDYCKALGLNIFEPDFYQSKGYIIKIEDLLPEGYPKISLHEAQQRLGFI